MSYPPVPQDPKQLAEFLAQGISTLLPDNLGFALFLVPLGDGEDRVDCQMVSNVKAEDLQSLLMEYLSKSGLEN